ncbi:MAG TPA: PIG-L family deacetylase [Candidatus Acidoferrales bacterium]|nr:PIG-L family deacetylase [Candidatus Acidoferrales bacterium]
MDHTLRLESCAADFLRAIGGRESVAVFIAAHPDDETIGAGALLSRLREPAVIHATDGAPRNSCDAKAAGFGGQREYAEARSSEAQQALAIAGVPRDRILRLGFTDQETSLALVRLTEAVAVALTRIRPDVVFTHSYEGGHPDHDSVALATHAAVAVLRAKQAQTPNVTEFTSYHARPGIEGEIETGCFLGGEEAVEIAFADGERKIKDAMFQAYGTQKAMLANFRTQAERFRPAPSYDFSRPPHPGKLYYEHFHWGMTGRRWRSLACEALAEMGLRTIL